MRVFYQMYWRCLLASVLTLVACAEAELSNSEEPIEKLLEGKLTTMRPEIGRLSLNGTLCTATLIRPQVVISAAHCIGYRTQARQFGDFVVERDGQSHRFPIDGAYSFGDRLGERDIALFHLSSVVPNTIATPTRIAISEPTQGEVTIFGYGCYNRRTRQSTRRKQYYTHDVSVKSNQLCPGDSGGPVVVGTSGPVFKINSGYYSSGRQGDIYGRPTLHYNELSAFANVMNLGGLSELQAFIRRGGIDQEGGDQFVGGGSAQQDEAPPMIKVISPVDQSEHPERSVIEIVAQITDDSGYVQPALVWDYNGNHYPCPHTSRYVSCVQEGESTYKWSVEVSEGQRVFRIRALDLAGKESVSDSYTLYLRDPNGAPLAPNDATQSEERPTSPGGATEEPPEEPTASEPPRVEVLSPTQHTSTPEESAVQIIAEINSDAGLREVQLVWDYNQNRYPCPTRQTYADCDVSGDQYVWTMRVSAAGARPFHIEAVDVDGRRGYSDSYQIDVTATPVERDSTPPQIMILEPSIDEVWRENTEVYVTAQITDPSGVAEASLQWDFNGNDYPCPHRSQYVDCDVSGDLYQWVLRVNEGTRSFRVHARDEAGNQSESESYLINLHP